LSLKALEDGVSVEALANLEVRERIGRFKYTVIGMVDEEYSKIMDALEKEINALKSHQ